MVLYSTASYVVVGLLITLIRSYDGIRFGHGGMPFAPWKLLKGAVAYVLFPFLLTRFYIVDVPKDSLAYSDEWDRKVLSPGTYSRWHLRPVKYIRPRALRRFQLDCSLASKGIKIRWSLEAEARVEPSEVAALWESYPDAPTDGVGLNSFIARRVLIPPLTEAFEGALSRQVTMSLSVREYILGKGLTDSLNEVGEAIVKDLYISHLPWLRVERVVFKRVDYEMSRKTERSAATDDVRLTVSLAYADMIERSPRSEADRPE